MLITKRGLFFSGLWWIPERVAYNFCQVSKGVNKEHHRTLARLAMSTYGENRARHQTKAFHHAKAVT